MIFIFLYHVSTQKCSTPKQIQTIKKLDIMTQDLNREITDNLSKTNIKGHVTPLHNKIQQGNSNYDDNNLVSVLTDGFNSFNIKVDLRNLKKTIARWHQTKSTAVVLGGNYDYGNPSGDCLGFLVLPLCTNIADMNILARHSWDLFENKKPDVLFTEHVLEHLTPMEVLFVAMMSFRKLNPGGVFRVAVPDGYKPSAVFQEYIRAPKSTHKTVWNVETLPTIFKIVGFDIRMREYYDTNGKFHAIDPVYDDDWKYGKVQRSAKYDPRQKISKEWDWSAPLSLWFDAIKPLNSQSR